MARFQQMTAKDEKVCYMPLISPILISGALLSFGHIRNGKQFAGPTELKVMLCQC